MLAIKTRSLMAICDGSGHDCPHHAGAYYRPYPRPLASFDVLYRTSQPLQPALLVLHLPAESQPTP